MNLNLPLLSWQLDSFPLRGCCGTILKRNTTLMMVDPTAGELRIIKSDLSKLEKTMDATKDKLATFKSDLDAVKRTSDGDNQSYSGDFTNNLSTVKESVDETKTTVTNLETDLSAVK
ncbi:hypothetical protein OUZ56_020286 [Daphnia magna]|uniref:Uncharacterized protein n=1 Tax=Daphnia magna TaxID=35525 RepID=A0ABQ9ZE28_9CRUS|nr:hypothetical protein OUZ56_020286 [Daphnia magna]